ncbi:MAG: hypothetical protein CMK59_08650 [Proteobacteria bacterium]|nr:hypothetical protein [Pseudomonadota bacterium]
MAFLKGMMTIRRYEVVGEPPKDYIERYTQALKDKCFRGSLNIAYEAEHSGWATLRNFLDTDFSDPTKWHVDGYILANFRVDKKKVPSKIFRARVQLACDEWLRAQGENPEEATTSKIPSKVRKEIKDRISTELLSKTLPSVRTVEWCWNVVDGYCLFHNISDGVNELFQTAFYETFGLVLSASSPVDLLNNEDQRKSMEVINHSSFRILPSV